MIGQKLAKGDPGYDSELDENLDNGSTRSKVMNHSDKYATIKVFNKNVCNPKILRKC